MDEEYLKSLYSLSMCGDHRSYPIKKPVADNIMIMGDALSYKSVTEGN